MMMQIEKSEAITVEFYKHANLDIAGFTIEQLLRAMPSAHIIEIRVIGFTDD